MSGAPATAAVTEALSPELSLAVLGLRPETSTLSDAVDALLRMRSEMLALHHSSSSDAGGASLAAEGLRRRPGSSARENALAAASASAAPSTQELPPWGKRALPDRRRLVVLLSKGGIVERVLGEVSSKDAGRSLADLGLYSSRTAAASSSDVGEGDSAVVTLTLATYGGSSSSSGGAQPRRGLLPASCKRRWRRGGCCGLCGCCGACCAALARGAWSRMPERWRERLKPHLTQWKLYFFMAKWGAAWLWQDRNEMLGDLRGVIVDSVWKPSGPPPQLAKTAAEQLRPFALAGGCAALLGLWDVGSKLLLREPTPEVLELLSGATL
eukprot:TRINITY_DN2888_c0_g3_i1.p1 TRINITY_DN2888_c0_g3~~TRINITY_DN2888_c0_g3_i1.p1  ORF type:complete len:326 (+),score=76.88 TRINITY_DN2888_c0_g3_i1:112-1089(+)